MIVWHGIVPFIFLLLFTDIVGASCLYDAGVGRRLELRGERNNLNRK